MIKNIIISIVLASALITQGCSVIMPQRNYVKSAPVESIVRLDDVSKSELYVRANDWMVDAFKDSMSVIKFSDKESGTITGRYLLQNMAPIDQYNKIPRYVYASIRIKVKDNASKITITPDSFYFYKGYNHGYTGRSAERDVRNLISSFESAIKIVDNDNW